MLICASVAAVVFGVDIILIILVCAAVSWLFTVKGGAKA